MQPFSGVVNEDGNEISLNSDPRNPSCRHPDLLEACDATHCHPCHYVFLTMFNSDDSVHIQANLQLILQAGSYQTVSQFPEMSTFNTQCILFMYYNYNSIRKPAKDF